ncbi:hypothetical protein K505DRAFT_327690, partial [Melanomma pulvis-pyrius CBS 109.77]
MSTDDSTPALNVRTPLALVIKTVTTHAFALASYAYASSLLRRPTRANIQALRLLFFLFVPTLPLVEILFSAIRSLLYFLRNYEEDEEMHFRFYLSSALGMHASLSQDDDNKEDGRDRGKNLYLLKAGSHCVEKTVMPLDWVWAGKLLAATFGVAQAVGSIVMWVRRMVIERYTFGFDHRNGAMGIAATICGVTCMLVLIIRLNWKVSKTFEAPAKEEGGLFGDQRRQFFGEALLAMALHMGIAAAANRDRKWMYTSTGSVAFLLTLNGTILLQGWQSLMLIIFIYIFRKEISTRLGLNGDRFQRFQTWFGGSRLARARALLGVVLAVWVVVDLVWVFVADVVQVVNYANQQKLFPREGGYWWQDPLSESLIV